jgi:hypothetical protein
MPANFCMEPADWEGNGVCYDPSSKNCKTCEKDFPETVAICRERTLFLGIVVNSGKAKKASGPKAERKPKNGKTPQSLIIDGYITEQKSIADMVVALAAAEFNGDSKQAAARITSHLKAIKTGSYCRAETMKPQAAYLAG